MFPTTLIIGLGGVGSRITVDIYRQFAERNKEKSDAERKDAESNLACLCFDTDAGDIKKYMEVLPQDCVIQTSSSESITVGQYINKIKDSTTVEDWFDTDNDVIIRMKLNEGAGQVRMASRLAYMSAMAEEKLAVINNSIRNLLKTNPERHQGNEIKIHIICSLAGGTGAGSFLQTAYYVKDIMRSFNVNAPKVTGYFVLGDVLCHDTVANLNEQQKENTRANTYACMKELAALTDRKKSQLIKDLEFEYKLGQEDLKLPTCDPYDHCYMIDFTNTDGTNIGNMKVYYDQVRDFVYMNAFSPMGDTQRSLLINNTIQDIQTEGKGRFAAIGVSKLVFPVDDLYEYFAIQRLVDNLSSTWIRIDNDFLMELDQYKTNKRNGIATVEEPERGEHFKRNVVQLALNGTGMEQTEFRAVYESTQQMMDGISNGAKSEAYLESVAEYVKNVVENNPTFKEQYENCNRPNAFSEDSDKDSDISFVNRREEALKNFKDFAFSLIESLRRGVIRECFLVDAMSANRVTQSLPPHHLNSYLLPKGKELHPLAVRYFLYDVRDGIRNRLESEAGLKQKNQDLHKAVEGYATKFDIKNDKLSPDNHQETAAEALTIEYGQQNVFNRGGVRDFKAKYIRESKKHRENVKRYSVDKLLEYVYEGLLSQIMQLIEESENFFLRLPDTLRGLKQQCEDLLVRHEGKTDPTVMYVLATKIIKQRLYEKNIKMADSLLFPNDISARIYRSMFDDAKLALEQDATLGSLSDDEEAAEAKEKAIIEANNRLFQGVIGQQIKAMSKTSPEFLEMNILQALKKEGELYKHTQEEVLDYMKTKIRHVADMAVIRGAYNIDVAQHRYINSWGINSVRGFTEEEIEFLFEPANAQPQDIADCVPNDFYSQYELVRANSVSLLELEKNFKGFSSVESDSNADGHTGTYKKAYEDVDKRIVEGLPDYSRHLDKRWQLPAYMPNIGENMKDILGDIFAALYYGFLLDKFAVQHNSGDDYWYFQGDVPGYITDFNGYYISLGGTSNLESGLNELFERGLIDNPSMVKYVNECIATEWKAAKKEWQRVDRSTGDVLELMKSLSLIKKMKEGFDYGSVYSSWTGKKWFSFLSTDNNSAYSRTLEKLKTQLFDGLIGHIVDVFEPSANTRKLCDDLFDAIPDDIMKTVAKNRVETLARQHVFELRAKK